MGQRHRPFRDSGALAYPRFWFRNYRDPDYWRVSPAGRAFIVRGYQEDSEAKEPPGTIFDLVLPVWRVAECLLHAYRLSQVLCPDPPPTVTAQVTWEGLAGRELRSWANTNRRLHMVRRAFQDTVQASTVVSALVIRDSLPEVVASLTRPLYEIFGFFQPPEELFAGELAHMTRGT